MIDVHSHILPGLDDGSPDMEESLALARQAVAENCLQMVCTPHANAANLVKQLAARDAALVALRQRLEQEKIPLTLIPGMEYRADGHSLDSFQLHPGCRMGEGEASPLLVELPFSAELRLIGDLYFSAQSKGIRLILAHPERYDGFARQIPFLKGCLDRGLFLQFNAQSLAGGWRWFRPVLKGMLALLEYSPRQILLGSDAHQSKERPAGLICARKNVVSCIGEEGWRLVSDENAAALLR